MELAGDEIRVLRQLDDLYELAVRRKTGNIETGRDKRGPPVGRDWSAPVTLQQSGNNWTLPAGQSANFFRVRLTE